ncbi:MAG: hypothetical protein M5U28_14805 [Sandaracinaceae bacterium]|nr:hypothetical protein [Sandaracinaceae bacterium]
MPAEVRSYELRLYRVEDEGCPERALALTAAPFAELAHAQSFEAAEGMGEAIGEIPGGTWAMVAVARDAACAPLLYGCSELSIGVAPPARGSSSSIPSPRIRAAAHAGGARAAPAIRWRPSAADADPARRAIMAT